MISALTPKKFYLIILINNEPILTSTLAAGIVQDTFVGEAGEGGGGEGVDWRLSTTISTAQVRNSSFS